MLSKTVSRHELMKSSEVCDLLRISRGTLQNWIREGRIEAIRMEGPERARLLFRRSEVEALLGGPPLQAERRGLTPGQRLLKVRGYLSLVGGLADEQIDEIVQAIYERRREPIEIRDVAQGDVPA